MVSRVVVAVFTVTFKLLLFVAWVHEVSLALRQTYRLICLKSRCGRRHRHVRFVVFLTSGVRERISVQTKDSRDSVTRFLHAYITLVEEEIRLLDAVDVWPARSVILTSHWRSTYTLLSERRFTPER